MIILGTNSIKDTGYNVANSLRFDDGSSDFLNATNSTPTNNDKCTLSVWIKRSALGGTKSIIGFHTDDNNRGNLVFDSDKLEVRIFDSGSTTTQLTTNQVFRDISAWYHIVLSVDTTQSTASSRVRIYVNGSEVTDFGTETNPSQNQNFGLNNSSVVLKIGQKGENNDYFDGYMAEFVFIDGQQLDPTSFGEFDSDSPNIWNLTAVDQSTDTCTNNFATGNPIAAQAGSAQSDSLLTFSEGNLLMAANSETGIANFGLSKGKWFWEVKVITDQDGLIIGACNEHFNINAELGYNSPASASGAKVFGYYGGNGTATVTIDDGSGFSSYGSAIAVNNIVSVALDLDSADQSCTFYLNGSSQGALDITNLSSGESYFPAVGNWSVGDVSTSWNFGSPQYSESGGNSDGNGYGNFSMAVPSGYHAINTKNLAEYG